MEVKHYALAGLGGLGALYLIQRAKAYVPPEEPKPPVPPGAHYTEQIFCPVCEAHLKITSQAIAPEYLWNLECPFCSTPLGKGIRVTVIAPPPPPPPPPIVPKQGILLVDTMPVKGHVLVDGTAWGTAPQDRLLDIGRYRIDYGGIVGYDPPSPIETSVFDGMTTTITGVYSEIPAPTLLPPEVTIAEREALLNRVGTLADAGVIDYTKRYELMVNIAQANREEFNDLTLYITGLEAIPTPTPTPPVIPTPPPAINPYYEQAISSMLSEGFTGETAANFESAIRTWCGKNPTASWSEVTGFLARLY